MMLTIFKDFLLNIFVIFFPLVLYPFIHKASGRTALYRLLLYLLFAATLAATMSFPINLHGLVYDYRSIPLVMGSLYGGWPVSVLLYLTLMFCRFLSGAPHNLVYALSLSASFVFIYPFLGRFGKLGIPFKIAVSVMLCALVKLLAFALYLSFLGQLRLLFQHPLETLQNYLMQGFIIGLCVYLLEFQKNYFHMQEEFIRSEKMKVVSEMAASVAHEIRNPLTTVKGFIHLFGTLDLDPEKRRSYKNLCFEELERAERIISDYLSLAKPDPETIERININEEVGYLSNVLLTYANYNNIEIRVDVSEESGLYTIGDRHKFRQALVNIGKNAIEAMPEGGLLELRTAKRADGLAIAVKDTGTGMTPEQIKRLGSPYYSAKEKGTGLGTMVSFGIIRKMNGRIQIESEVGKGTEFTLVFPEDKGKNC